MCQCNVSNQIGFRIPYINNHTFKVYKNPAKKKKREKRKIKKEHATPGAKVTSKEEKQEKNRETRHPSEQTLSPNARC